MSRLTTMSPAALRAVFSPDADADLFFLLTIYDPQNPSQVVARLSDGYTQRISETADEVVYGVQSRSQNFIFLPMEITLPSEDDAQAPRCTLTLNDVTRYVTPLIRTINGSPKVLMELVLSSSPNTVEASFSGFYISSITYNANTVSAELAMIDYEREPFPQHSFSPKYFPGLF
jgi:hypothetical protein